MSIADHVRSTRPRCSIRCQSSWREYYSKDLFAGAEGVAIRIVPSPSAGADASRLSRPSPSRLRQDIHFCTASDGVRIAYAEVGEGPPIVKAGNWLNHLEYDWESPIWSHLLSDLASEHRLIRHDARGNGLSDWDVDDISFDASATSRA